MSPLSDQLRSKLLAPDLTFAMEAHNGLSARVVEAAGFEIVWASGFAMSATQGLADRNLLSWSQVAEIVEHIAESVDLPVLVDCDTGFGDAVIAARVAQRLQQRGVAGICVEDKVFPKFNSFVEGDHGLEAPHRFASKLRTIRDAVGDGLVVVARTETFIAGRGQAEALERAYTYAAAGADAILVHSKAVDAGEVLGFMDSWRSDVPIVVVPTKYFATPTEQFRAAGISCVIWANHLLRASVAAMVSAARRIRATESVATIDGHLASMEDVFALTSEPVVRRLDALHLASGTP